MMCLSIGYTPEHESPLAARVRSSVRGPIGIRNQESAAFVPRTNIPIDGHHRGPSENDSQTRWQPKW